MNKKGFSQVLVIVVAVIAVILVGVAGYVFFTKKTAVPTIPAVVFPTNSAPTAQQGPVPQVKTPADLNAVANDLDQTNLDSIDNQLNQNAADATSFAPRIRAKNGTSTNWAGYAVANNTVSDVKGSWSVPTVTCTPGETSYSATWLGIDGYNDGTVEQIGTDSDCRNGVPTYYAWYEMYPKPSRYIMAVAPGQSISAGVSYINGKFVLNLNGFTTTQKSNAQRQSAEWIVEAPWSGGVLPLANFGTVTFTNAKANGVPISSWGFVDPITMVNSSGGVKAQPSSLSPDGTSFSVTWKSN